MTAAPDVNRALSSLLRLVRKGGAPPWKGEGTEEPPGRTFPGIGDKQQLLLQKAVSHPHAGALHLRCPLPSPEALKPSSSSQAFSACSPHGSIPLVGTSVKKTVLGVHPDQPQGHLQPTVNDEKNLEAPNLSREEPGSVTKGESEHRGPRSHWKHPACLARAVKTVGRASQTLRDAARRGSPKASLVVVVVPRGPEGGWASTVSALWERAVCICVLVRINEIDFAGKCVNIGSCS